MYSEADIEAAISAGALTPGAAAALRDYVAESRRAGLVDEEHFRLISGFNDIFVTIAALLLLGAVGGIGVRSGLAVLPGALVAGAAWGLAEFFTAKRRMALPSIVLLLAFVGGVFAAAGGVIAQTIGVVNGGAFNVAPGAAGGYAAIAAGCAAGAAWLHWRRFHVPITVAAGTVATVGLVLALILSALPARETLLYPLLLIAGLAVFAVAMWWDTSDRTRETRRADVAFWLHLLAAPLIVHPVFHMLGLLGGGATMAEAALVVVLYVALAVVALAIDRRALMVSALAYVIYAMSALFREFGALGLNFALTALVIGSALLLLSAFWHVARATVLGLLPAGMRDRLPVQGRSAGVAAAA